MSRIGKKSIIIPDNVTADINNGVLTVVGPKGQLSADLFADVDVQIESSEINIIPKSQLKIIAGLIM